MEATDMLKDAMELNPENGDLYYNYAQVFRYQGDLEKYKKALEVAIKNNATLNYSFESVKKELKNVNAQLGEGQQ